LAIWGFWVFWGYLANSDAKSDVVFLVSDPDFLLGRLNFAPISIVNEIPILDIWGFGVFGVFS